MRQAISRFACIGPYVWKLRKKYSLKLDLKTMFHLNVDQLYEMQTYMTWFNALRSRQNGRDFSDDIFNSMFLNQKVWISIKVSMKFALKCTCTNKPLLVHIKVWRRTGNKPLSEPMMDQSLLTHLCVTRSQWVKQAYVGLILRPTLLTLQRRHNGRDCVSNHQPYDCLLNRLIRLR